jgi:hypothetical protein
VAESQVDIAGPSAVASGMNAPIIVETAPESPNEAENPIK